MGIFSRKPQVIEAQYAPQVMGENLPSIYNTLVARVSRHDAMSIPSVARARNLICGTVASIPLEYYKSSTGEVIAPPRWIKQLSKSQPSFVTLTWIVDSLLFYGVSYLLVTERYAEDGRPASFEWVAKDRKSTRLNSSHITIPYAVYFLKNKNKKHTTYCLTTPPATNR